MQNNQLNKLNIKFSGTQLPAGKIDVYDFANTALSLADTIRMIGRLQNIQEKNLQINISSLKRGSFEAELIAFIKDTADITAALLPVISQSGNLMAIKSIFDILKNLIEVKKFLKGDKPKQVTIEPVGQKAGVKILNIFGETKVINVQTYNAIQNKDVNKSIKKAFMPLLREDGNVENIELIQSHNIKLVDVKKEEAKYFEKEEELNITPNYKVRGIITALDRKTGNGKMTVGKKRLNFELSIDIKDLDKMESVMLQLIESLKLKMPVMVMGEAVLDYESNLKKMIIQKMEADSKLME